MTLNLVNMIIDFLKNNAEKKYTTKQIAEWIFETYPDRCREKKERSRATNHPIDSDKALLQQISAEVGARRVRIQKKEPQIKIIESHPYKYYYTKQSDANEAKKVEEKSNVTQTIPLECNLYPMLIEYLKTEHGLYVKRIDEKKSTNKRGLKGNEWLYPDLVALEDLASEWSGKVTECAKRYGDKKAKLWSFEVKREITIANVRSTFFQAVSNSSWANFGYLVATELEEKAKKELRMLSSLHGNWFYSFGYRKPIREPNYNPRQRTS